MVKGPESTAMIIGDFNKSGFCNLLPSVRLLGLFDTFSLPFFDCHDNYTFSAYYTGIAIKCPVNAFHPFYCVT